MQPPNKMWHDSPACSFLSWVNRALLIRSKAILSSNRIAAVEGRLTVLEASAPERRHSNWGGHFARCSTSVTWPRGGTAPVRGSRGHLAGPERRLPPTSRLPYVRWTRQGKSRTRSAGEPSDMPSTWGVDGLDRDQGGAEVAHLGEQAVQLGLIGNWATQGGGAVVLDLRVASVARAASAWPRRRFGWCGPESQPMAHQGCCRVA